MVTSHAYKLIDTTLLSAIINEQYFVNDVHNGINCGGGKTKFPSTKQISYKIKERKILNSENFHVVSPIQYHLPHIPKEFCVKQMFIHTQKDDLTSQVQRDHFISFSIVLVQFMSIRDVRRLLRNIKVLKYTRQSTTTLRLQQHDVIFLPIQSPLFTSTFTID